MEIAGLGHIAALRAEVKEDKHTDPPPPPPPPRPASVPPSTSETDDPHDEAEVFTRANARRNMLQTAALRCYEVCSFLFFEHEFRPCS
jgi:hypothetical protein